MAVRFGGNGMFNPGGLPRISSVSISTFICSHAAFLAYEMPFLQSLFGSDAAVIREINFQLLLLAAFFSVLGTSLVSPILDSLIEPFGASPTKIGLMVSFVTAPSVVLTPDIRVLADRYGRKPILVAGLS